MPNILTPGMFSLNERRNSAPYVLTSQLRSDPGHFLQNGIGFNWQGVSLLDGYMKKFAEDAQAYRRQVAEEIAPVVEAYMKQNAPWKDRTGQTRAGLKAVVSHRDNQGQSDLLIGYTTFNGVFLENKTYNGKSYAILRPTLAYFAPLVGARMGEYRPSGVGAGRLS